VVISRAGAGTISELCLVGKPTILIPSPNVSEDHQTKNAMALVEKDAAVMIADSEIDNKLFQEAFTLIDNNELCMLMSANIRTLAKPEATKTIVDEVEKLIEK
jgi:UDP-N-acetylglucosamine--N-acetylmuramyl-(pentapeptide) pyrophosphoryl-undecaprenol N-acetylglucosamine transferase